MRIPKIMAIIPARSGSKGILHKNIYPLNGIPLIEYTLKACRESKLLADWVVSTDDKHMFEYTNKVLIRPEELAEDCTPMLPVIQHVLSEYPEYDTIMLLQPTSPLRSADDIDRAISMFASEGIDSLVSVFEGIHPIKSYDEKYKPFMRQSEPYDKHKHKCYTRNGAIFIATRELVESGRLTGTNPVFYIMPKTRSVDIDDYEDLKIAEALLMRGDV